MKPIKDPFPPTPEGFHLRIEKTLYGLEENEMTKRKFSASLALILTILMIAATAMAASAVISGGYVGFDGIVHGYDDEDADPEIVPPSAEGVQKPDYRALESVREGECWIITKDGKEVNGASRPFFYSTLEELASLIEGTNLPMFAIPDGYDIVGISIMTEPEAEPYAEAVLLDGAIISKYKFTDPIPGEVTNYSLQIWKVDELSDTHAVDVCIVPARDDLIDGPVKYLNGGEECETVEVEGFEYGLYIKDPDGYQSMRLLQPMGDQYLIVDVHATTELPKSTLMSMFPVVNSVEVSSSEPEVLPAVDYSAILKDILLGEYWEIECADIEGHIMASQRTPDVASLDDLAKLTALPVPVIPEGCAIERISAMPEIEAKPYETITLDDGSLLKKYRMIEVTYGNLDHYSISLTKDGKYFMRCEVFAASSTDLLNEEISRYYQNAEELSVPGYERALRKVQAAGDGSALLLLCSDDACISISGNKSMPAEAMLAPFPAE